MDQQRKKLKGGEKGMRMVSAKFRLILIRRSGKSILTISLSLRTNASL
jgi:hypothetical protein